MRFGVIGLLVALFLVGEGVTRLIETFKFTQLQSMTLAQFEQHPLSEGWIQISGAHTALGNSVMIGTTFDKSEASKPDAAPQTINEYLAPLTDAPGDGSAPAKLYLDSEQADDIARAFVCGNSGNSTYFKINNAHNNDPLTAARSIYLRHPSRSCQLL